MEKLLEKVRHSKTDLPFTDLEKILSHAGYTNVRQKGSHVHFRKPHAPFLTVPVHNGRVKIVYVKEIISLLSV